MDVKEEKRTAQSDAAASPGGSRWEKGARRNRKYAAIIAVAVAAAVIALMLIFVVGVSRVVGNSMFPTYRDGDTVWYLKTESDFSRGEVVSIKMPSGEKYVKRIAAVPGDTVDIRDGSLYVNGRRSATANSYGRTDAAKRSEVTYPLKLDEGKYFVLGDNREHSVDSRTFGPVDEVQILGVIVGENN
jgi:signal peptidase I